MVKDVHPGGISGGEGEELRWGRKAEDNAFMGTKAKGSPGNSGQTLRAVLLQLVLSMLTKGTREFFIHLTPDTICRHLGYNCK